MAQCLFISCASYQYQNHAPARDHYVYSDMDSNMYMINMVHGVIADTSYLYTKNNLPIEVLIWNAAGEISDTVYMTKPGKSTSDSCSDKKYESIKNEACRTTESIVKTIRTNTPGLRKIFERYLANNSYFSGRTKFRFVVSPDGRIKYIYLLGNTTGSHEFTLEVLKKINYWRFDPEAGQAFDEVTVPFFFSGQ